MPPGIEKDICKMNIDLWMHQNTLMWTRLKTLWFVQFGLLALAGYLSVPHPAQPNTPTPIEALNLASLAKFAALLSAITTFGLWVMMRTDRLLRNTYRKKIEQLDLGFFPASLGQSSIDKGAGTKFVEPIFFYVVFLVFVVIDLLACGFYGLGNDAVFSFAGAFALACMGLPVTEVLMTKKNARTRASRTAGT